VKLRHLAKWNEQRRERTRGYDELFTDSAGTVALQQVPSWSRPVYHLYAVRIAESTKAKGQGSPVPGDRS